jgi:hypothetical protein
VYFPLVFIANLIAFRQLKKTEREIFPKFNKKATFYLFLAFYFLLAIFYRFYDSAVYVGPGNPDTIAHLGMLQDIISKNYIGNSFYAPGFHLYILPIAHILDNYAVSRFAGPAIGIFILIGIYFLFRDKMKISSSIFLLTLLSFPLFGKFIIQTIGFCPTVFTFLFLSTLIVLLTDLKISQKQHSLLNFLLILALAVTVPYFFVQYLLYLVVFLAVLMVFFKSNLTPNNKLIRKKVVTAILVLGVGYVAAFSHVLLETRILRGGSDGGFPTIRTIVQTDQGLITSSNKAIVSNTTVSNTIDQQSSSQTKNQDNSPNQETSTIQQTSITTFCSEDRNIIIGKIACNKFSQSMIIPLYNTGLDIVRTKNILPLNTFLNDLSYLAVFLSIVLIIGSCLRKNLTLLPIAVATFVYGFMTITGIFEMSDYRGRSGYYFFFLAILLIATFFDQIKDNRYLLSIKKILILVIFAGSIYLSIKTPMIFPRLYYPEIYTKVREIKDLFAVKTAVISTTINVVYLDKKLENLPYAQSSLSNQYPQSIVILEKNQFDESKTYASVVFAHNWEVSKNDPKAIEEKARVANLTKTIRESVELKTYSLYWENDNIEIYLKKL